MTDETCIYEKAGNCAKGLPGTPCETEGCVAHTTTLPFGIGMVSREDMERFCLDLQRRQQSFIDMNRRLMEAGKIEFNEYEEL